MDSNLINKLPTYFISHGGGPWPWMDTPFYGKLEKALTNIPKEIAQPPRAILMVSGHWEEDEFAVMGSKKPPMIYDYGGFPPHTYKIQYNAPGSPELAQRTKDLLSENGIKAYIDKERGYDHGTFVPMQVMFPEARIPLVQLSIKKGYDPKTHLDVGRALAPLREEGVLIVGSGLTYHDLRNFPGSEGAKAAPKGFDDWLQETLTSNKGKERERKLMHWSEAPYARSSHPEEDHLIPLMVAVGSAGEDKGSCIYHEEDFMGNLTVSSFKFG